MDQAQRCCIIRYSLEEIELDKQEDKRVSKRIKGRQAGTNWKDTKDNIPKSR